MKYTEPGRYELLYSAVDGCGNKTTEARNVEVFGTAYDGVDITMTTSDTVIGQTLAEIKGNQIATIIITNGIVAIDGTEIAMETPKTLTARVQQSGMFPQTRVLSLAIYVDDKRFTLTLIFRYDEGAVHGFVGDSAIKFTGNITVKFSQ